MASPAFCISRATTLLIPYMFLATLVLPVSLSSGTEPTHTFCSGRSRTSSPVVTAREVEQFLGAVSAGAHSAFHRSYNASLYIDAENRTMYAVAQCRPDVPTSDCIACLAASCSYLTADRDAASCADSAVWHDRCFLRYSERDTSRFREDELAATVFNSRGRPARHGRAAVTGLLAAVADRLCRSMQRRRLLGSRQAADGVAWGWGAASSSAGQVYGVARCAPGIARADCGRCLRGALAVAERDYNGSAGMQVLRLSCTARYESYRFYSESSITFHHLHVHPAELIPSPAPAHADVIPSPANRTNTTTSISSPNGPKSAIPPAAPPEAQAQTRSHGGTKMTLLIVLIATAVAAGAILGVILPILLFFWSHRKRRQNRRDVVGENVYFQGEEHINAEEDEDEEISASCQRYTYKILEVATCHFSNSNKLGSGGFGTVYKGTLDNGEEVAVKRLKDSKRSLAEREREVSIVAKLRHEN